MADTLTTSLRLLANNIDCEDGVAIALVLQAADEIERLREAIRRLADQDATLSACDGAVTVQMDATLTDAEREAIELAYSRLTADTHYATVAATLRKLLDRLSPIATGDNDRPQPIANCDCPAPDNEPKQDTTPPEWMSRPYLVDPSEGWRYGFPRLYDPATDGNMTEWLIRCGYPEHLARQGLPCTFRAHV